jgi:hypothetical protein
MMKKKEGENKVENYHKLSRENYHEFTERIRPVSLSSPLYSASIFNDEQYFIEHLKPTLLRLKPSMLVDFYSEALFLLEKNNNLNYLFVPEIISSLEENIMIYRRVKNRDPKMFIYKNDFRVSKEGLKFDKMELITRLFMKIRGKRDFTNIITKVLLEQKEQERIMLICRYFFAKSTLPYPFLKNMLIYFIENGKMVPICLQFLIRIMENNDVRFLTLLSQTPLKRRHNLETYNTYHKFEFDIYRVIRCFKLYDISSYRPLIISLITYIGKSYRHYRYGYHHEEFMKTHELLWKP